MPAEPPALEPVQEVAGAALLARVQREAERTRQALRPGSPEERTAKPALADSQEPQRAPQTADSFAFRGMRSERLRAASRSCALDRLPSK
jgi:hypothetical protein